MIAGDKKEVKARNFKKSKYLISLREGKGMAKGILIIFKLSLCVIYLFIVLSNFACYGNHVERKLWSVSRKGNILEIAYGSQTNFPQYAAFHLNDSYFRMTYGPSGGWGTSVILFPSFWESGQYYQGNLKATISATWRIDGNDLIVSFKGDISSLHVDGKIRLLPPSKNKLVAEVTIKVSGNVQLDKRPGEAFKPVMLSSMHISDDSWDAQSAYVDTQIFPIPKEGWIIQPPVTGKVFGLKGGTSKWNTNAPTIEVRLSEDMQVTGWVTPSNNPNDDNVGFWAATDKVIPSWKYTIVAKP